MVAQKKEKERLCELWLTDGSQAVRGSKMDRVAAPWGAIGPLTSLWYIIRYDNLIHGCCMLQSLFVAILHKFIAMHRLEAI